MISDSELVQFEQTLKRERKILQDEILFFLKQSNLASHQKLALKLVDSCKNKWVEILWPQMSEEIKPIVKSLDRVEASLSQIELGLFGLCADCEVEIDKTILFRNPSHQRCDACHQRYIENPDAL